MRRALYAAGSALMAYGAYGLLTADKSAPLAWARFAATVLVAHDALLAPLAIGAGVLVVRLVPGATRRYVQSGLFISVALTLLALPFVLGYGRSPDLPSALPLDYGTGLAITLVAVWTGVGAVAVLRRSVDRIRTPARAAPPAAPPDQ